MKKIFALLMVCALVLMTGCGGSDKTPPSADETKLGMIAHLNTTEQKMKELYDELVKKADLKVALNTVKFFDNLSTMQMGLESNDVNEISVYSCVANYLSGAGKYESVPDNALSKLSDSFCFAVRKDDTELKAQLDKAIDEMKSDGTLDKLVKDYITDAEPDNIPRVEIPMTDGAPTIKVGVTGDLPPLDLVLPDGTPAGFNTAMLAEIAKRIGRNIELVNIDSGARAAALASNQIDVIFWAVVPNGNNLPAEIDKPEGVEFSTPYFKDSVKHLKIKS